MATSIKLLVKEAVSALKAAQYQESTIYEYNKTFAQLLELAEERQIEYYCNDLAEEFRNDTGNKWTGQYSLYRWKRRNRCIEMFNWYEEHGYFKLDAFIKTRIEKPATKYFQELHSAYLYQLSGCDLKQNTVDSYRNISCKFLQLLEKHQYTTISDAPVSVVYDFISHIRNTWSEESLRTALSGLRSFLVFTESEPLLLAMLGLKAPKVRKIIPVLMPKDEESLEW